MADPRRPQPSFPEPDTQPFWDATKQHELRYQTCDSCKAVVYFPRRHCPFCMSFDLSWQTSKGEGTVYTCTVVRQIGHPFFRPLAPYVVAWIDMDEGFRVLSNVVGVDDPTSVTIGRRVRVTWEDQEEGLSIPVFEPI
jgi:uncharacterized OB-fold protein